MNSVITSALVFLLSLAAFSEADFASGAALLISTIVFIIAISG